MPTGSQWKGAQCLSKWNHPLTQTPVRLNGKKRTPRTAGYSALCICVTYPSTMVCVIFNRESPEVAAWFVDKSWTTNINFRSLHIFLLAVYQRVLHLRRLETTTVCGRLHGQQLLRYFSPNQFSRQTGGGVPRASVPARLRRCVWFYRSEGSLFFFYEHIALHRITSLQVLSFRTWISIKSFHSDAAVLRELAIGGCVERPACHHLFSMHLLADCVDTERLRWADWFEVREGLRLKGLWALSRCCCSESLKPVLVGHRVVSRPVHKSISQSLRKKLVFSTGLMSSTVCWTCRWKESFFTAPSLRLKCVSLNMFWQKLHQRHVWLMQKRTDAADWMRSK